MKHFGSEERSADRSVMVVVTLKDEVDLDS